jgi:periplasmic divalent cation tolerance protein
MRLIYTPCSSKEEAKTIASSLLEQKLIACANIIPNIQSLYIWEGELRDEEEFILLSKCKEKHAQEVERKIEEMHSYECPCILQFSPQEVNPLFAKYIDNS